LTIVHDVAAPIYNKFSKHKTINELKVTRLVTLCLGCIAIVIGLLRAEELCKFMDLSYLFTGPLLAFPLFAGVMGLKPDKYALYIASIVTVVTLLFTKWLLPEEQQRLATLISVCVNGILFLGIHVIRNKGFAIVKYEKNTPKEI
jgi:Na+/proline symporter